MTDTKNFDKIDVDTIDYKKILNDSDIYYYKDETKEYIFEFAEPSFNAFHDLQRLIQVYGVRMERAKKKANRDELFTEIVLEDTLESERLYEIIEKFFIKSFYLNRDIGSNNQVGKKIEINFLKECEFVLFFKILTFAIKIMSETLKKKS